MARTKQTARRGTVGPQGGRIDPKKNFPKKKTPSTTPHRVSTTGSGSAASLYQPKAVTAPKPEVSDETDDLHDGKNILELYKETSEKEE